MSGRNWTEPGTSHARVSAEVSRRQLCGSRHDGRPADRALRRGGRDRARCTTAGSSPSTTRRSTSSPTSTGDSTTSSKTLPVISVPSWIRCSRHVSDAPPTPVASNAKAFVAWARAHPIPPIADYAYSAYPGATVRQIRSAGRAGRRRARRGGRAAASTARHHADEESPRRSSPSEQPSSVLPRYLNKGGDAVGTVHFAHLVKLPHNQVGFFTVYDGPFDKYAQDFADQLGPAFDLLFRFTKNPPPTPTSKNAGTFSTWVKEHDLTPLAFYSGYPGLQVQDVKALLAGPWAPRARGE